MRRRRPTASRLLIVLAVALGVVVAMALRDHLSRLEARASAAGPARPTVVAAVDLERGTALSETMLRVEAIPERYVPPGALARPSAAAAAVLAAAVEAGEPVTASRLAPPGGPVAALVPSGLRAVAVTVAVPPGAVVAGDHVDLLATYAGGQPHTETVLAGAEVLVVTSAGALDRDVGAVTLVLLVDPDAAERVAFARAFADLSIAVDPTVSEGQP